MRFWILLAAVVGYHVTDVYEFLLIYKHYHPEYPGMVIQVTLSPGLLFLRPLLFVRLTNAAVYGVVAYLVLLSVAKFRRSTVHTSN